MAMIAHEAPAEAGAREALLDRAMGPHRKRKPSERLRTGRLPAEGLSLVARDRGKLVGTVRLWHVKAGERPALLLGPLAVDPEFQGRGIGSRPDGSRDGTRRGRRPRRGHPRRRPGVLRALRLHRRRDVGPAHARPRRAPPFPRPRVHAGRAPRRVWPDYATGALVMPRRQSWLLPRLTSASCGSLSRAEISSRPSEATPR